MARRAKVRVAIVRLVVTGVLILGIMAGGTGLLSTVAASQGCETVNDLPPTKGTDYTISNFSWEAGEQVAFTAGSPFTGNPSIIRLLVDGTEVAYGSFPGTLSYTIPSTGQIAVLWFKSEQGSVTITVTCEAAPTATPTITPTQTATSSTTPSSTPLTIETPSTDTPTHTVTATVDAATHTPTNTPTRTPTATTSPTKTSTATATPVAGVAINPTRRTVNTYIHYTIVGYPANAPVQITWKRLTGTVDTIGTVETDATGGLVGKFKVPAVPGGPGQLITFAAGSVSKMADFEVAPRIKIIENPVQRGQIVEISLRGYAKNESVRIRWKNGSRWETLATVVTSNTGSANLGVKVPHFAPDGFNSVRGDGSHFRQQTNVVNVQGATSTAEGIDEIAGTTQSTTSLPLELIALPIPLVSLLLTSHRRPRIRSSEERSLGWSVHSCFSSQTQPCERNDLTGT